MKNVCLFSVIFKSLGRLTLTLLPWLVAFSVQAQAPVSLKGAALFKSISSGAAPFSSSGYSVTLPANVGNTYSSFVVSSHVSTTGTATYVQSNADGLFTGVDSVVGPITGDYLFATPTSGTYAVNGTNGGFQDGTFTVYDGTALTSLAGKVFNLNILDGGGGNAATGTGRVSFTSPSTYTSADASGTNTGTYTYSLVNKSTGKLVLNGGKATGLVSFTDAFHGGFALSKTNGAWTVAAFAVQDLIPPTLTVTAPIANQRWSNDTFTVTGKAADNAAVAGVFVSTDKLNWTNATSANAFTNWAASLGLNIGTNTIYSYAVDTSGNASLTNAVKLVYVLSAQLTISLNGRGTISPNYSNAFLQLSNRYTVTATAAAGFDFTNWTDGNGNLLTNKAALSFVMASNLVLTANFLDVQKPTISITNLPVNGRASNSVFIVQGKAADNLAVSNVFYNLNNAGWITASLTNNNTSWNAPLALVPGTNTLSVYALDTTGNISATNSAKLFYVVSALVNVQIIGRGTLTPDYNGQSLAIGNNYSMKATPASGFVFSYWSGDVAMTTNAALTFNLASNLTIIANFRDVTRPVNSLTYPLANQRWSNSVIAVAGKASDNLGVASVWVQINSSGWMLAGTANGYTNWSAANVPVSNGTNFLQAYAEDAAGNVSLTNTLKFIGIILNNSSPSNGIAGMALVPNGSFTMGNSIGDSYLPDANPTNIAVSAFYMDTNLVTYGLWQTVYAYATSHGYSFTNAGSGVASDHPVQRVDWYDAVKWCNARSLLDGLTPVYYTDVQMTQVYTRGEVAPYVNWSADGYRLPTEAEWEKAARGGLTGQRFPWGNTISWNEANYYGDSADYSYDLATTAGYDPDFNSGTTPYTSPVGVFAANGYGLFDMAGNVDEWCWDWYGTPYGQPTTTNPTGPGTGTFRMARGGSWLNVAPVARSANRIHITPNTSSYIVGFRCVRAH